MTEQQKFERYITEKFFDVSKNCDGHYMLWQTQLAWKIWQETRAAAIAAEPDPLFAVEKPQ